MPFYSNMTAAANVSDALIALWEKAFIVAASQDDVVSGFADTRFITGKSDTIMKYTNMTPVSAAITEDEDVTRQVIAEVPVTITPLEYGSAVTRTSLASLQTGGQVDIAAFELAGRNMGRSMNVLGTLALEGSSNIHTVNNSTYTALIASEVINLTEVNKAYNALSRANIMPVEGGLYIAMAHDDVLYDLRNATTAGSWMDLTKYSSSVTPLTNEIGSFGGFRWIRNNDCAIGADVGASAVDVYKTSFFGARALMNVVSKAPGLRMTGPFDALARFVNIGWYGVFKFGLLDVDAVYQLKSASSVGANV